MKTAEETTLAKQGADLLLDVVNTFVVKSKRIDITIELHYDLSLPDVWDDSCRLWTPVDAGVTYDTSVQLMDSVKVTRQGNMVQIRFGSVLTNKVYSCLIDQGGGATVLVFENLTVTQDMAA